MKISTFKASLTILVLLTLTTGCASTGGGGTPAPPAAPAAVGTWAMTLETPQGTQSPTLTIAGAAGSLTGSFTSPTGELALDSASSDGDAIDFQVTIDLGGQALVLIFSGTIEGDMMSGSFASDFGDFPATAVRQ
jgi:hypothetical protein